MASEGVIKLKGDNSQLDQATDKSVQHFKKLGQHASQAHGHAKSFGQQWEHANGHMLRTIAHGASIFAVLEKIVETTKEFQQEAQKAAKSVGDIAVSRDTAAAKLGISNETAAGLVGGESPVELKDRAKFFSGLADKRFGRGKRPLGQQQVSQIMQAFNSGLYDEKEIDTALEKGDLSSLLHVGTRYNALSDEAKERLATQSYINGQNDQAEDKRVGNGNVYAAAEAHYKNLEADHPGLALVPGIVRDLSASIYKNKAARNEAAIGDHGIADIVGAISFQTDELKDRKPTVAKPASGD